MTEYLIFAFLCWAFGVINAMGFYYAKINPRRTRKEQELKELLVDGCRVLYWNTDLVPGPMGRYPHRKVEIWFDEAWKVGMGND